eukprot:CAMPEP_0178446830 /NCGR_PEP_ID=MMETSP0689_2-20121128/41038_1 /TAXON_ID=160604 /ORGANISM="Amphidinium massartii, Strain CS-259" /LENGTH=65 /DNA_ID=CAMNT_0020071731 /DNA_START=29 /DNA_END=223 /DNA_ORIENTATION=+
MPSADSEPPCCIWVECQLGLLSGFAGAALMAVASVFMLFNSLIGMEWYLDLCVLCFLLGLALLAF